MKEFGKLIFSILKLVLKILFKRKILETLLYLIILFGQIYLPAEENIHICSVPRALVRTLKLSISELGGRPYWLGPISSLYLDGSGMSESAMIHRSGNKYSFMKVQNNVFGMGTITFSSGIAKVQFTTDNSDEITLSALGLVILLIRPTSSNC